MATRRRAFRMVLLSSLTTWLFSALPTFAAEPALVVSVKSFNELLADSQYLGNVLQQPMLGLALPGVIAQATGGKGLKGLEQSKPIGLYVSLSSDGKPQETVVFVPVTNQKTFSDTLSALFPKSSTENGITQYQPPNSRAPIFVKPGAKHFVLAQSAAALQDPIDPDKLVKSTADIAIEVDLAKIPNSLKETFLAQAEAGAAAAAQSNPSQNEARRRGEEAARPVMLGGLRRLVMDGERLSLGLNVDAKGKTAALEIGFTAKPNTELARAFSSYSDTDSPFASLIGKQTLASFTLSTPLNQDVQDLLYLAFEQGAKQAASANLQKNGNLNDSELAAALDSAKPILDAIRQTIKRGRLDYAVIVNSNGPGKIQVFAGAKIAKGKELGKLFEQAVKKDDNAADQIQFNVATAKGAPIHGITLPKDEAFTKNFGEGPAHLAFSDDAILLCFGADSLAAIKAALEATPAKTTLARQTRSPIALRIGLSKLLPLIAAAEPNLQAIAKSVFVGGNDEVSLEVARQPNGAKIRFEVQEGVLKLFGQVGAARSGQAN